MHKKLSKRASSPSRKIEFENLIYRECYLGSVVIVKSRKMKKPPTTKELLEKMRTENRDLFAEIAEFVALLQEFGVSSYKLSGSIQEPIISNYSIS